MQLINICLRSGINPPQVAQPWCIHVIKGALICIIADWELSSLMPCNAARALNEHSKLYCALGYLKML